MVSTQTPQKILILSSAEIDENIAINDAFVNDLNELLTTDNVTLEWHNYHDVTLELASGEMSAHIVSTGESLLDFDAVYFKSYFRYHEQAASIAEYLQFNNIPFVGSELRHYIAAYKLTQMARLARKDVMIPRTLYFSTRHYVAHHDQIVAKLGERFIFKAINGSTGDDNYLVTSKQQLEEIVANNEEMYFIAQEFIPNESDLRLIVLNDRLRLIIERRRADDSTHLNNTSQGAEASLVDMESFDQLTIEIALRSAEIMGRDVAGVDIMLESGTGKPYVLEVNASPQIASGSFEQEKRALYRDYFKEVLGIREG